MSWLFLKRSVKIISNFKIFCPEVWKSSVISNYYFAMLGTSRKCSAVKDPRNSKYWMQFLWKMVHILLCWTGSRWQGCGVWNNLFSTAASASPLTGNRQASQPQSDVTIVIAKQTQEKSQQSNAHNVNSPFTFAEWKYQKNRLPHSLGDSVTLATLLLTHHIL